MISATVGGNVGTVEMKTLPDGTPCLSFSVASNDRVKGEEATTWIRCSMFGKRADGLAKVLAKGSSVMVTGSLRAREYEGKNGKGVSLDMDVDRLAFIGGKRDGAATGDQPEVRGGYAVRAPSSGASSASGGVAYPGVKSAGDFEVRFGRDNGKPISLVEDLSWLRGVLVKDIENPDKAQFHDKAKAQVNAIDAELARRKGGAAQPSSVADAGGYGGEGGGYGAGGGGDDDIPF